MNAIIVSCLILGCVVYSQAQGIFGGRPGFGGIGLPDPGNMQNFCYDTMGNPVMPGQTYFDGCNRCRCGNFGQAACTRMACPGGINPNNQINPINPVYPPIGRY